MCVYVDRAVVAFTAAVGPSVHCRLRMVERAQGVRRKREEREGKGASSVSPVAVLVQQGLGQGVRLLGAVEQLGLVVVLLGGGAHVAGLLLDAALLGGGHDQLVAVDLAQRLPGDALHGHCCL